MAKFAPVVPPQILQYFKDNRCLGDYHLLLAHDIVKKPKLYHEIFDRPNHSSMEIILDNSVIELGGAVDLGVIVEAAHIVNPTVTVLPDVMLDTQATIVKCQEALAVWAKRFEDEDLDPYFMIVPQGTELHRWIECAEVFANQKEITHWGIPRNVVKCFRSRQLLPELVYGLNPSRDIHLLGFSDNVVDDIITCKSHYVHGIDSAVPIRAVSQGIPLRMANLALMPPRGDWWEKAKPDTRMFEALYLAKRWCGR